jgi:hypothetical protein
VASGGVVFGIPSTIVTPPASAAAVPVAKSSLCSPPGTRKWVCTSINPGKRIVSIGFSPFPGIKKADQTIGLPFTMLVNILCSCWYRIFFPVIFCTCWCLVGT